MSRFIVGLIGATFLAGVCNASGPQDSTTEEASSKTTESLEMIGDAARGVELYQRRCAACHSIDQNRVGPKHRHTFGSKADSVEGFAYSKALEELDVVWNEATLDEWLQNPSAMVPGTRMGFRLTDEQERADIIAYLRAVSEQSENEGN